MTTYIEYDIKVLLECLKYEIDFDNNKNSEVYVGDDYMLYSSYVDLYYTIKIENLTLDNIIKNHYDTYLSTSINVLKNSRNKNVNDLKKYDKLLDKILGIIYFY